MGKLKKNSWKKSRKSKKNYYWKRKENKVEMNEDKQYNKSENIYGKYAKLII
jgi:hypothetical protein